MITKESQNKIELAEGEDPLNIDYIQLLYKQYISANIGSINIKQQQNLVDLFCLSYHVGFDVGSWVMKKYEKLCLDPVFINNKFCVEDFIENLKISQKFIDKAPGINYTRNDIKSMLINYVNIHLLVYTPLPRIFNTRLDNRYNVDAILSYMTCLNVYINKLRPRIIDGLQINIKFVPCHSECSLLKEQEWSKAGIDSRSTQHLFDAIEVMISSTECGSCTEPIILRSDNDVLYLSTKALHNDICGIQKYESLIDNLTLCTPEHDILTLSYTLSASFSRTYLFYGECGVRLYKENVLTVLNMLFDEVPNKAVAIFDAEYEDLCIGIYFDDEKLQDVVYQVYNEDSVSDKIIYIPKEYTTKAMNDDYILESFESKEQLFYYLRWRSILLSIHGLLRIFKYKSSNEILVFCTDLHTKHTFEMLYIVGTKNTKTPTGPRGIEKWKMSEYVMTAHQIKTKYDINPYHLPLGVTSELQSIYDDNVNIYELMNVTKNRISMEKYVELPILKTNKKETNLSETYSISKNRLNEKIRKSNTFVPIISFNKSKTQYYMDIVLLVNIGDLDNIWIGIIFSQQKQSEYHPIGIAIDCVDIWNKMSLFKAPNGDNIINKNNITKLMIQDSDYVTGDEKDQIILELKRENELLNEMNNQLSDINNYYFKEMLNPDCNVKPHKLHLPFVKQDPLPIIIVTSTDNNNQY